MGREAPGLVMAGESGIALIDSSVKRVATRLEDRAANGRGRKAAKRDLAVLTVALGSLIAGEEVGTVARGIPATASTLTLLDQIGHELIHTHHGRGSTEAVGEALRAWSTLRQALTPAHATAAPGDRLREQLQGPDAFELLVEVAHDFRSPLTSILFLAETLRDGHSGKVSDLQRSQLGLVYSAAFGLASVASDVVDLARQGQDLVEDEPQPFGLAEVFRNVERMVRPIVEEKGLELCINVPDRGRADGHPHALTRVLLNLTTNALRFTDRGSVELGVKQVPYSRLEFYVRDTGRGISPERQNDLFQPFKRRLGGTQEGHFFSGSGVGLSIAHRLVQAMGSTLEFETSAEGGTRFYFVL